MSLGLRLHAPDVHAERGAVNKDARSARIFIERNGNSVIPRAGPTWHAKEHQFRSYPMEDQSSWNHNRNPNKGQQAIPVKVTASAVRVDARVGREMAGRPCKVKSCKPVMKAGRAGPCKCAAGGAWGVTAVIHLRCWTN